MNKKGNGSMRNIVEAIVYTKNVIEQVSENDRIECLLSEIEHRLYE